ncbi:MAG: SDR family oxidoreductase [Deltaproteobacteria bacterium]|nr:SDR family oxidoreductase [Deltaproteobacteria bacterium]MCB9785383.1 SDR family oxidoreductase [Deltaproteobacteria bacterium]
MSGRDAASTGQVVVVTGAASGIGRHLTAALAGTGRRVLACDIDEAGLARAMAEDAWPEARVLTFGLDVRDAAAWDSALALAGQRFGPVDVLMNVAGFLRAGWTHELELGDIDRHIDINTKGVILGTRAAARAMVPRKTGHIVNIGSLASLAPVSGLALYAASKFAVRGFSLAAAGDLRPHGVAVTVVMPDAVATPMLDQQVAQPEAALTFSGSAPLTVEDITHAILHKVLPHRPLELTLPWSRGAMARAGTLWPGIGALLDPLLRKKGLKNQASR